MEGVTSVLIVENRNVVLTKIYPTYEAATADMFVRFGPVNGPQRYYRDAGFWHQGIYDMEKKFWNEYKAGIKRSP